MKDDQAILDTEQQESRPAPLTADPVKTIQYENSIRKWLPGHCLSLPGVARAIAVMGNAETRDFRVVATWPQGFAGSDEMLEMADVGFTGRSEARRLRGESGRKLDRIAMPIFHQGQFLGALIVEADGLKSQQRKDLYNTINGNPPKRTSGAEATSHRLAIVLDVLAACLDAEPANVALHAMVNELANRTGCDRVSLGRVVGMGMVQVLAISTNDKLDAHDNTLRRLLSSAMVETVRRNEHLVYPCRSNSLPADCSLALLSRCLDDARVMTLPFSHAGQVSSVLLLERHGNTSFGSGIVELCQALARVAGPVIDLKLRRDEPAVASRFLTRLVASRQD